MKHQLPAPFVDVSPTAVAAAPKKQLEPKKQRPPPKLKKMRTHNFSNHIIQANTGISVLQHIVESRPDVYFFTHSGTRSQRMMVTSDPKDLNGPHMNQRLNMIFFLKSDMGRIFDLKQAAVIKKQRENAASVIGSYILRLASARDIAWAMPWSSMTQHKKTTIWEHLISTRQHRATSSGISNQGWTPLSTAEMHYAAMGHAV